MTRSADYATWYFHLVVSISFRKLQIDLVTYLTLLTLRYLPYVTYLTLLTFLHKLRIMTSVFIS